VGLENLMHAPPSKRYADLFMMYLGICQNICLAAGEKSWQHPHKFPSKKAVIYIHSEESLKF